MMIKKRWFACQSVNFSYFSNEIFGTFFSAVIMIFVTYLFFGEKNMNGIKNKKRRIGYCCLFWILRNRNCRFCLYVRTDRILDPN